jgi:hypothetical protein
LGHQVPQVYLEKKVSLECRKLIEIFKDWHYYFIHISEDQADNQACQVYQEWKVIAVWMEAQDWMEHPVYQVIKVFQAFQVHQDPADYQAYQ